MANNSITFYDVGKANCCLVKIGDKALAFDIHGSGDQSSYDLLSPSLPQKDGKRYLDVLCISHGDEDHCGGFREFKEKMDAGELVVGSIWHPNYDRTIVEGVKGLSKDYLALRKEILRRRDVKNAGYGDIEIPLTAWDTESKAFTGLEQPKDLSLKVLSPYLKDDETDLDVNDASLVINLKVAGLSILFPGDSSSEIWQERIFPYTLKKEGMNDWALAPILVASHHGSYTFFGKDRDEVREADPQPDNYDALHAINPQHLIVSAGSRFPTSGDSSGDQPPHFAAWKWYHRWFKDNRGVKTDDKHPDQFKYTADGNVRLEYENSKWKWVDGWSPDDGDKEKKEGFDKGKGETQRVGSHYA